MVVKGLAVWNAMQRDANLLDGISLDDFRDLAMTLVDILPNISKYVPVSLAVRIEKSADSIELQLAACKELLRIPEVVDVLNKTADEFKGK